MPGNEDTDQRLAAESKSVTARLTDWGSSAIPPSILATLTIALHTRPARVLPLALFTPPLFLATWLNLAGLPTAAAGISSAWSGLYALLAMRRNPAASGLKGSRFGLRGAVRGAAVGLGVINCVAGGLRYVTGDYDKDEQERVARNRWGS